MEEEDGNLQVQIKDVSLQKGNEILRKALQQQTNPPNLDTGLSNQRVETNDQVEKRSFADLTK